MMEKRRIHMTDRKILEVDERTLADTKQLLEKFIKSYSEESLKQFVDRMEVDANLENAMMLNHYEKGRRLWLEVDVEDSFGSSALLAWLYTHSTHANSPGLRLFGCRLNSIIFNKPSDFNDQEREAIIMLYNKVIGDGKK